jgi:hypothetical protein
MKQRHNSPRGPKSSRQQSLDPEKPRRVSKAQSQAKDASIPVQVIEEMAVQSFEPEPDAVFSIEHTAHLAGVPRRTILIYCKHGLISPITDPTLWGYWFSAETIRTLRRIESLRATCGDDLPGIGIILDLMKELQALRAQLRATI